MAAGQWGGCWQDKKGGGHKDHAHHISLRAAACPQAVIHCEIIRQAARVVAMDCERLRSGDRACVRFR